MAPHDPSAAQQALSLPSILTMILNAKRWTSNETRNYYFHPILGDRDLANVIRVNHLWFEIGTQMLWASRDSIDWLSGVPPVRRQIYASKMAHVSIQGAGLERYYREYNYLVFERLAKVSIAIYDMYNFAHVKPYLVPSLQSFSLFYVPELESEVFSRLARASPNLRDISIAAARFLATFESLSGFIRHAPLLRSLTIYSSETTAASGKLISSSAHTASGELLSSLAHSNSLERLQLPWCWTEFASQQAAAAVSHSGVVPFPRITDLTLNASSKAIGKLVPLVVNTKHLALTLKDSADDVLPHVSNLRNLQSLIIHYQQSSSISRQSLLELGALSRLSILHLCSSAYRMTGANLLKSHFSDHDCEALARRLPNL